MARGVNSCLFCRQFMKWRDDAWRLVRDGSEVCAAAPTTDDRRQHKLAPSS